MAYTVKLLLANEARQVISTLWNNVFDSFSWTRYEWMYEQNPSGAATVCALYQSENGETVGAATAFPRMLRSNGTPVPGAIAADFMITRNHRSAGPALTLQRGLVTQNASLGIQVTYGFPNTKSAPIVLRIGYHKASGKHEFSLPIRADQYVANRVRSAWMRWPLTATMNFALGLRPSFFKNRLFSRLRTDTVNEVDERFDGLFKRISHQYILVGDKSTSFLKWRYINCPSTTYSVFIVSTGNNANIDGYIVYSIDGGTAYISDFAFDQDRISLNELLIEFANNQRKHKICYITTSLAASTDVLDHFLHTGFRDRGESKPLVLHFSPNSQISLDTLSKGSWYLTPGDND